MVGVIVSPKKTFADIARRPTWLAPFLILCILSVAAGALVGQKTDWRSFFEHQNSKNANFDRMPPSAGVVHWSQPLYFGSVIVADPLASNWPLLQGELVKQSDRKSGTQFL